ncbi:hypothetical protein AWR36_004825 [Microbulbifer flavimaris]|uniref:Uncharacterized protein n=1 Tax=Microbulbifer flavimaris TaxID=1781068 RepID=A0ABX4I4S1_9GAMM|nr:MULTISPECIES: hypothetical protein [Microbulbifer]KUJ84954.1 hypothetical protein AVO43_04820 [Microbulbifer sp. ZGT114]PCO07058.1 hypothetical protein AWR36_004825 [Microbulbifer flavimaris]
MKNIFLAISVFLANYSFACEKSSVDVFIRDVKVYQNQAQTCTSFQMLLSEFVEGENRYIDSAYLNIIDENNEVVAQLAPELERPAFGNLILSMCLSKEYIENSRVFLNVKPLPSVKLKGDGVVATGGHLCLDTRELVLSKLVKDGGEQKLRAK